MYQERHSSSESGRPDTSARSTSLQVSPEESASTRGLSSAAWNYDTAYSEGGFDAHQMFGILRRRKRLIALTFLAVLGFGIVSTMMMKPIYRASSRLIISTSPTSSSSSGDGLEFLDAMAGASAVRNVETQMEIIKGRRVMNMAQDMVPVVLRPAVKQSSRVDVSQVGKTDIVQIDVESRNRDAAVAYCDAIMKAYSYQDEENTSGGMRRSSSLIREKLDEVEARRDEAGRRLRDFKKGSKVTDLKADSTAYIADAARVEAELQTARATYDASAIQLAQLQNELRTIPQTLISGQSISPGADFVAKRGELNTLETQLAEARREYTDSAPEVQTIRERIAQVKQEIARAPKKEINSSSIARNPAYDSTRQKISELRSQMAASRQSAAVLEQKKAELEKQKARIPDQEYELSRLTSQLQTLEQTYQLLNQKYQQLRISENTNSANTRVLEPANASSNPISPNVGRNVLLSILGALVLSLGLAAFIDRLDTRVHSEEEAENAARLPTIARVPAFTGGSIIMLDEPRKGRLALLESYRMLRTNIAFASIDEPIRSLVVTSTQPNEGKSTAALDLAIVMTMDGKNVILVDADLRLPSIHEMLQMSNTIGFSSVITDEVKLEDALRPTPIDKLRVLTSGPVPPNPPELLNSRASRNIIQQLIGMCDFLIIDTPPSLSMTDGPIMASIADATVLVVSAESSNKKEVARTADLLAQTGTKLLGIVINKIGQSWGDAHSYYGKYNSYYQQEGKAPASALSLNNNEEQ